jgi:hypothetical protein
MMCPPPSNSPLVSSCSDSSRSIATDRIASGQVSAAPVGEAGTTS